ILLTSENSMQGENYEHSRTGACPYTSSAWRSFGLARRMAARGAVSQRSGVIRDSVDQGTEGNTKDRAAKFKPKFKSSAAAAATAAAALPTVEEGNAESWESWKMESFYSDLLRIL